MKLNCNCVDLKPPVVFLWISVLCIILTANGCHGNEDDDTKKLDDVREKYSEIHTNVLSSSTKLNGNGNAQAKLDINRFECDKDDKNCEKDLLGFEAIKSLHLLIDDDHNGNVDLSESDEFLRDELQYTDGFERQELFHNNDKLISVEDLWKAWKHSAVYNWTVDDMIEWLVEDVDLPQYSQVFHNFAIDGSALPRLINSTSPLLMTMGIRNPVHKQKLSLKAMDTILFGAPKRLHSYVKDVMLFMAILLAIGISWFACLHHRYSQTQVKKMMKDLEALQNAEDALKKLSKELVDAERNQISMPAEKQEELRMLRQNSLRLQVPRLSTGDKSPIRLNRQNSGNQKQEGEIKLKQAQEELANLREALSEAANRLEIHQQLESQWSVPCELQVWLQLTHELEQLHFNAKRQAAEKQLQVARDGCEKIKKRKQALFGSLRMAHNNSLDDIDQSILDARAALEEVKQDLQERLHRWHTIEILCGFPVIGNPGLNSLKQALGRTTGGTTRLPTSSLMSPVTFEDAEDDLSPTALLSYLQFDGTVFARPRALSAAGDNRESDNIYNQIPEKQRQQIFAWAHRSRRSYWMKQKTLTNDGNRDSDIYNQIPERPRQQIFAWAHRSRHSYWTKKKTLTNDESRESENVYNQIPERPRQQIFAWAHRIRHSYWMKKKIFINDENRESENIYNQIPERPRQQIFAWAHRSRLNNWLKKKTMTNGHTPPTVSALGKASSFIKQQTGSTGSLPLPNNAGGSSAKNGSREPDLQGSSSSTGISPATVTAGSSANSVIFQVGESSQHERSHSNASLSLAGSSLTSNTLQGHVQGKTGLNTLNQGTALPPIITSSGLRVSNSSGNLLTNSRASSLKLYSSASGNHLTAKTSFQQLDNLPVAAQSNMNATNEKVQSNDTGDIINNNVTSPETGNLTNSGHVTPPVSASDSAAVIINSQRKSTHLDDSDGVSMASVPKSQSSSLLSRSRLDRGTDLDLGSLQAESVNDSRNWEKDVIAEKKNRKKKTRFPKFLQKKDKQKTS